MLIDQLNMLSSFYSTIAQAIAAIIALFGLFATFRIQYSNMQKEEALRSLRNYIKLKCFDQSGNNLNGYNYVDPDVQCWLDKDVSSHLREIIVKGNTVNKTIPMGFIDYYLFINSIEYFSRHMIKRLMQYMFSLGLFLIFNIFAIYSVASKHEWFLCSHPWVTWVTIIFFGIMIGVVILYTRDSLKGPNFIAINNTDTNKPDACMFLTDKVEKIIIKVMKDKEFNKSIIKSFKAWI